MAKAIPDWVFKLKNVAEVGPEKFVLRRITQYVIGAVVGVALTVAGTVGSVYDMFASTLAFAASEFGSALVPGEGAVLADWGVAVENFYLGIIRALIPLFGPFAAPIVLGLSAVFAALTVRTLWAASDSIPVVSSIAKFVEGR